MADEPIAKKAVSVDGTPSPAAEKVPQTAANSKMSLIIVFISVAVDLLGLSIILPTLPFLALELDEDVTGLEVGIIFAAYAAAQAISLPLSGRLSDIYGRRKLIMLSLIGSAGGFLFQGLANSIPILIVARAAAGMVGSSYPVASAYVADVSTVEERPKYLAALGSVVALSFLFGPSIGAGLAELSLRAPMFVASGLATTAFLVAAFKMKESPRFLRLQAERAKEKEEAEAAERLASDNGEDLTGVAVVAGATPVPPKELTPEETEEQRLDIVVKPLIRMLYLIVFVVLFSFSAFLTMIGLFVTEEYGWSSLELGFVISGTSITYIGTQMLVFGNLCRKIGRHQTAMIGCVLYSVGLALLPLFGRYIMFVSLFVFATGYGLLHPCLTTLLSTYASPKKQGVVLGTSGQMEAIGRVTAPLVMGLLFEESREAPFVLGGGIAFLCLFLLAFIFFRHRSLFGDAVNIREVKLTPAPEPRLSLSNEAGLELVDMQVLTPALDTDDVGAEDLLEAARLLSASLLKESSLDRDQLSQDHDAALDRKAQQAGVRGDSSEYKDAGTSVTDVDVGAGAGAGGAAGGANPPSSTVESSVTPGLPALLDLGAAVYHLLRRHGHPCKSTMSVVELHQAVLLLDKSLLKMKRSNLPGSSSPRRRMTSGGESQATADDDEEQELADIISAIGAQHPAQ